IRTLTPLVIASVMANFTTAALFHGLLHENYTAIFYLPFETVSGPMGFNLSHSGNLILLGLVCGLIGASFTRVMYFTEEKFAALRLSRVLKPAMGGALLG